jgi:two-component system NtrC family sensor kinase
MLVLVLISFSMWVKGTTPVIVMDKDWKRTFFNADFEILPIDQSTELKGSMLHTLTGFQSFDKSLLEGVQSKNLIRFSVHNPESEEQELYYGSNKFEYVRLWISVQDSLQGPYLGGHKLDPEQRQVQMDGISFLKGKIPPGATAVFYLLLENKNAPQTPQNSVPPGLFSKDLFQKSFGTINSFSAFFYGAVVAMALFNLLLFFINPFRAYLYYTVYIIIMSLFISCLNPVFAFSYFGHMDINVPPVSSLGILAAVFYALVGKEFLRTRENFPKFNKVINVLIGALLFSLIGAVMPALMVVGSVINFTSALIINSGLLVLGAMMFLRKDKAGTYFFFASALFLIAEIIMILQMLGLIPYQLLGATPQIITQVGMMVELALFSLGLGYLYNQNKEKLVEEALAKEKALKEQEEKQRAFFENKNQQLEQLVAQRTAEISEKSRTLEKSYKELQVMQHQLIESEKMASLGQFTAGVAAEIKDPINFVANGVSSLEENSHEIIEALNNYESIDPETYTATDLEEVLAKNKNLHLEEAIGDFEELFRTVENGVSRTVKIVTSLRNFSRLDEFDYKKADIHDGLNATLEIMQSQFKGNITVEKNFSSDLPKIFCYPGKLNQAFMSLINQCLNGLNGAGKINISTMQEDADIVVSILHNGTRLDQELVDLIKNEKSDIQNTKTSATHLKYAQYIIKEHEGKLIYQDDLDGWCVFSLYIPARQS